METMYNGYTESESKIAERKARILADYQPKTKQQAGSKGGRETVRKYGREYMQQIGKAGARATWTRYSLKPISTGGYAMVNRQTNTIKAVISFQSGE